ncbi:hypothetical protein GECvBGOT_gp081 [Salmonella phage GEC_vB_GOT]|nr:hypothetical protein GECvBGOT_gp081 [Salmonella phage GEC_vB_GOT]
MLRRFVRGSVSSRNHHRHNFVEGFTDFSVVPVFFQDR